MIRIVWGIGYGTTPSSSFDAALAEANVHEYNIRRLSSVIPADVSVDAVGTAPDLGATGNSIDAAMARQTSPPGYRASAGMAWARDGVTGPGIFTEVSHEDAETVERRLEYGIDRSCELRDFGDVTTHKKVVTADPAPDEYVTAVVLAVYGDSDPIL